MTHYLLIIITNNYGGIIYNFWNRNLTAFVFTTLFACILGSLMQRITVEQLITASLFSQFLQVFVFFQSNEYPRRYVSFISAILPSRNNIANELLRYSNIISLYLVVLINMVYFEIFGFIWRRGAYLLRYIVLNIIST